MRHCSDFNEGGKGGSGSRFTEKKKDFSQFTKYKIDISRNANKRRHFLLELRKPMRFCSPRHFSTSGKQNEIRFPLKMAHVEAPNGLFVSFMQCLLRNSWKRDQNKHSQWIKRLFLISLKNILKKSWFTAVTTSETTIHEKKLAISHFPEKNKAIHESRIYQYTIKSSLQMPCVTWCYK